MKTKLQDNFSSRVYSIVAKIPKGKTMTYKEVAAKAGNPKAARAVGMLMSHNYNLDVPCHRVVRSDGKIGGYNRGGAARKEEILREEGFYT
ncbi:MAG TPA: MGMT family protein [Candidatus Paceibacterota bacterium]|nr:MGMT family protein [Candidatus Paceibacterota bacterium]